MDGVGHMHRLQRGDSFGDTEAVTHRIQVRTASTAAMKRSDFAFEGIVKQKGVLTSTTESMKARS